MSWGFESWGLGEGRKVGICAGSGYLDGEIWLERDVDVVSHVLDIVSSACGASCESKIFSGHRVFISNLLRKHAYCISSHRSLPSSKSLCP